MTFWRLIVKEIDADVATLALALALVAVGFWSFWKPGSFLVPGFTLLWIVLPVRRAFIERQLSPPMVRPRSKRS